MENSEAQLCGQLFGAHELRVTDRPEASVLCCSSSGDNFGNKNSRVITDMGVIRSSSDAEAQARVSLQARKQSGAHARACAL